MKDRFLWLILGVAVITRFFYFNYPAEVVFDEVHFGKFVRAYFTGETYFDIHPPTGKLLIAGVAKLGGFDPGTNEFNEIGQEYDTNNLFLIRILPTIASVIFAGVIYLLTKHLTRSRTAAVLTGSFIVFENALITQAKFGLLDIFLLLFGFSALYYYLRADDMFEMHEKDHWVRSIFRSKRTIYFLLAGIALGLSYSIKWTGLGFAAVLGIAALVTLLERRMVGEFVVKLLVIFTTSFLIYMLGFAIHFTLLTNPGTGDAYLSPNFREQSFAKQFYELNDRMWFYNRTISTEHPFASKWYLWPFNTKPIYYWQETKTELDKQAFQDRVAELQQELIQNPDNASTIEQELRDIQQEISVWDAREEIWLVGNPIVWFLGLASIILGTLFLIVYAMSRTSFEGFPAKAVVFLILAWAITYLPFAPIARPLFLYHYFTPLVFSIILAGVLLAYSLKAFLPSRRLSKTGMAIILSLAVLGYFLVAPLTYGLPFGKDGVYSRIVEKIL